MNESRRVQREWSWEIFLACMFVGIGIGILLDAAGAGTLIGMGIGFLLASLIKLERKIEIAVPRNLGGTATIFVGILFVLGGLCSLDLIPQKYMTYLIALGLISLGVIIVAFGTFLIKK
ncbi:MAG: hypothetical protein DRJ41_04130 [Thermoprotei archaeon]|nr:MAG: hypothetical protein DRJ41_04130 [Thermoprotei archaeon]